MDALKLDQSYLNYTVEMLQKLTAVPSPTGYTKQISAYLVEVLERPRVQP